MQELLILVRASAEVAHFKHVASKKYSDHLLFQRIYETLEKHIDPLMERISSEKHLDNLLIPTLILKGVYAKINKVNYEDYKDLQLLLQNINKHIETINASCTVGTQNLIAAVSDDVESLLYLIVSACPAEPKPNSSVEGKPYV